MGFETALTHSTIKAVGVSFHKDVVSGITVGDVVQVIPEPENPYDKNALAVHVNGSIAGHFPAPLAERVANAIPSLVNMDAVVAETYTHEGVVVGFAFAVKTVNKAA